MKSEHEMVFLQPSESAQYIVYNQYTSSDFIYYDNPNSLIPSSLDQIMKNGVIVYGDTDLIGL